MRTEDLIGLLVQDATVRWKLQSLLVAAFIAGTAMAIALFLIGLGIRPDILAAGQTPRLLFKVLLAFALLCCAAAAVFRVGRPDASLGSWRIVFAALAFALGIAVATELIVTPEHQWSARLVGENAIICLVVIPTLALAPLTVLLLALRNGAPSHPGLAGAVAGLAASGIAATLYAIHCPDDSPLFVAAWYSLATAVVVSAGYFLGSRLLRW